MKKLISLILSLCIILSMNTSIFGFELKFTDENNNVVRLNDFLDTQGHWAHDIIYKVAEYNWVVGDRGHFYPNNYIKRGDLAIVLDRMLGLKTTTYNIYYDLPNNSYYRDALLKCVAAGYITGVSNNQIDPEGLATREQVAVIISRIFDLDSGYSGGTSFKDDSKISSWARSSISAMSRLGYINGTNDGYMNPTSYITRAELVTMLNNICNTYIPEKDSTNLGVKFKGDFPTNIVTSKTIELENSTVGRDIVMTYQGEGLTLRNSKVRGRILTLGQVSITIHNSEVAKLVLTNGKSSVQGADMIDEVYVKSYASESYLDFIPKRVTLEAGTRLKIGSVMYENESTRTKTYYHDDLHADIADEQGFTIGGPKISGAAFYQDEDNTISVSNVRILEGNNEIKEMGVVWLEQDEDENTVNPTYQKNDGKKIYRTDRIEDLIAFEVGEVENTCAYRFYVKDKNGLFAYSPSWIFSEYNYRIKMSLYDNNYPETMDIEVVFTGDNIPDVNSVRCTYSESDIYSEALKEVTLGLYKDANAEVQPDPTKYKRYTGTIKSQSKKIDGKYVTVPPTAFGYIITFKNGTIRNKFPILSNAIPEDVEPTSELVTGSVSYTGGNYLNVKNNIVTTRYAVPQEIGVAYKVSNSSIVNTNSSSGWTYVRANVDVDVNESTNYSVNVPLSSTTGYTHYVAYIKTSKGYWYGNVKSFSNSVQGDENGPRLEQGNIVNVLDSNTIFIPITFVNNNPLLNSYDDFIVDIRKNGDTDTKWLHNGYEECRLSIMESDKTGYLMIKGLEPNTSYEIDLQMVDMLGLKSNMLQYSFNTSDYKKFILGGKYTRNDNGIAYALTKPDSNYTLIDSEIVNNTSTNAIVSHDKVDGELIVYNVGSGTQVKLSYKVKFKATGYDISCLCSQIVTLN